MPVMIAQPQKTVEVISPTKIVSTSGSILWQDDFEGTNSKWTGQSLDTTAVRILAGSKSGKITTAGTTPWATDSYTFIPVTVDLFGTKVAIEGYIQCDKVGSTQLASFEIKCEFANGSAQKRAGIKWLSTGTKFQYLDSTNTYQDITGGTQGVDADVWYKFRLVLDLVSFKYISFSFANATFDLSAYSLRSGATSSRIGELYFNVVGIDATTTDCWIDNIVVTYKEP